MMRKVIKALIYTIVSVPLLYALWLLVRMLMFDYFTVPSSSMTPTIMPGSKVIVNKMIFGPRIYTDLHFDLNGQELEAIRLKGIRGIRHNDIVVFNYPIHNDRISFVINNVFCKRVTGLPGDTVSAVKGHLRNNNFTGVLGCEQRQKQLQNKTGAELKKLRVYHVAPRRDRHFSWNIKDWGPIYVPRKGDIIAVTPHEATLYRKILEWETGKKITWDWDSMKVSADNMELKSHCFRHNYYHICGDYALNSSDSRYWGLVPEEYIVGVVTKIIQGEAH